MITVTIGQETRSIGDALRGGWIPRQVQARRRDGIDVCVQVRIRESGVDLVLATPACPRGGGGRMPNARERALIDLWNQHDLNEVDFPPGAVVAFLKRMHQYV